MPSADDIDRVSRSLSDLGLEWYSVVTGTPTPVTTPGYTDDVIRANAARAATADSPVAAFAIAEAPALIALGVIVLLVVVLLRR